MKSIILCYIYFVVAFVLITQEQFVLCVAGCCLLGVGYCFMLYLVSIAPKNYWAGR